MVAGDPLMRCNCTLCCEFNPYGKRKAWLLCTVCQARNDTLRDTNLGSKFGLRNHCHFEVFGKVHHALNIPDTNIRVKNNYSRGCFA